MTAIRETREETGLEVRPLDLLGIYTIDDHRYPNGDIVHSIDVILRAEVIGGEIRPDGVETLDVRYFPLDGLPGSIFAPHVRMLSDLAAGRINQWD